MKPHIKQYLSNEKIELILNSTLDEIFYGSNNNEISLVFTDLYEYCCFVLSIYVYEKDLYFSKDYCENLISNVIQQKLEQHNDN